MSVRTDPELIARAAQELDQRLRGARVTAAGRLADGRIALALRAKDGPLVLALDVFGSPPLLTLEAPDVAVAPEPGFPRALDASLRGMTVVRVRARRNDRLAAIDAASRSRFGVGDEATLYVELVPRFGNAVLTKRDVVVAALKEFSLAENGTRAVSAGMRYELPPLPPPGTGRGPADAPVGSVLDFFASVRADRIARGERENVQRRKDAVAKRLSTRERKLRDELEALDVKERRAGDRDELRVEGERIFATLHERTDADRDDAKTRAAELFARYKKLGASRPHLERRRAAVSAGLRAIDELRWECERAGEADLDDVEAAVAALEPHKAAAPRAAARKRKRPLLELRTPAGSRIVVGRNPAENADVTFRIARPNDLWFHAQGVPGAHVVLARDDRMPPSDDDVETAAALAAFYSKAKGGAKVPVDYTLRKHVRKQADAPPGLVWYVHPKTVTVRPRAEVAEEASLG